MPLPLKKPPAPGGERFSKKLLASQARIFPLAVERELAGKKYADLMKMPVGKLKSLALSLPHPGHRQLGRAVLENGRTVFLKKAVLTPHQFMKPKGVPLKKWLAGLSEDERFGQSIYAQHRKLVLGNFRRDKIIYPGPKEAILENLVERLPAGHPAREGGVDYLTAVDEKNRLLGFISTEYTAKKTGIIGFVAVAPEAKRTGLTQKLYDAAFKHFKERGVRYVFGEIDPYGRGETMEHAALREKAAAGALGADGTARLIELNKRRDRIIALARHGRLLVKGFPYLTPGTEKNNLDPMNLAVTDLEGKTRRFSGKKLLEFVKDIHGSERLYGSDVSAVPAMEAELEKLEKKGKTLFSIVPLWKKPGKNRE
ncbi:MAG: GNAT family N-acetyltransferase [Candidatus Micrarchaeota archaeon]|nr:GNAT family N-acetyltransferase [Candidatus Micrarchaeota archaeon]